MFTKNSPLRKAHPNCTISKYLAHAMELKEPIMGSSAETDGNQQAVYITSYTRPIFQTMPNIPAFTCRSFLHEPVVCKDELCDVEGITSVEYRHNLVVDYEPMRTINLCIGVVPPRRFYRTFWRSLSSRLTKFVLRSRLAEETAYKIKIST